MIAGLRSNRQNEDKYIQSTMDEIRKELRNTDLKVKTVALQKLTYLNMLGFDMTWAAFHVVEVMSASKFTQKLVGYHAATQSFSENTEVMLLITNLLKKDLGSTLEHERSLALDCLSNVATLDVNVFAPLGEGESLPSTMAYPEARMTHAQHDSYDGSFRGPPEEGVPGDGQDALPQNEIFENNGKHKSRKKKHGEKGTKEHRHRRKHKHR